jgi:hypothetical protein
MKKRKSVEVGGRQESTAPVARSSEHAAGPLSAAPTALIAKKDFIIRQEPYERVIRAGEDISDVPAKYHPNLRTEGVL